MPSNHQTIPRADRVAALLDAARQEFADTGFDRTTIAAVARRAGMTSANVHYYFDGKDELFAAVIARGYEQLLGDLDRIADPRARLRRYVSLHKRRFRVRGSVHAVAARNSALTRTLERRDAWLRATVAEVVAGAVDREVLVAVVIGLVEDTTPRTDPVAVLDRAITRLESD